MYNLLIGIILFIAVLLILIVLVQNPKGGGLASSFSSSNQIMGVKRTADFVEKATWSLAAGLVLFSVIAIMIPKGSQENARSRIQQQIENSAVDPQMLPTYPAAPMTDPDEGVPELPVE